MDKDKTVTKEELRQLESEAIEKSEKGDKPYRKKYRKSFTLVTCYDCSTFQNLRLISVKKESSFKRGGHKKNRNPVPIKDNDGNSVYLCPRCIEKRAKGVNK